MDRFGYRSTSSPSVSTVFFRSWALFTLRSGISAAILTPGRLAIRALAALQLLSRGIRLKVYVSGFNHSSARGLDKLLHFVASAGVIGQHPVHNAECFQPPFDMAIKNALHWGFVAHGLTSPLACERTNSSCCSW